MAAATLDSVEIAQRETIELALRSETFQSAPVCCALLQYLYHHRHDQIGEYAIGVEALGRRDSFDPKSDSYVRVQVSRLRAKLTEFSSKEGKAAPLQIVVPRGAYRVEFIDQLTTSDEEQASSSSAGFAPPVEDRTQRNVQSAAEPSRRNLVAILATAVVILACLLAASVYRQLAGSNIKGMTERSSIPLKSAGITKDSFWGRFLASGSPVRIVVPNPTFYLWKDEKSGDAISVRSIRANEFDAMQQSPLLVQLAKQYGHPVLSQEYVSIYDATSAFALDSFLRDNGFSSNLSSSSALSLGTIDHETLILMGTANTLYPYQKYFNSLTLSFTSASMTIGSRDPSNGKTVEYKPIEESSNRVVIPQLFACLPGSTPNSRILLIEGYKNIATITYITSREGQDELQRLQEENGNSPFFEAVIMSEINWDTPIKSWIAAYKPIADNGKKF